MTAVEYFLRPRSIAIIGVSAKPGTAGRTALTNILNNDFRGDVHVVGRSTDEIDGRQVLQNVDDLPEGVDLAIFATPASGVKAGLEACVRRKVRAVTIFSSGFAEAGKRAAQDELVEICRDGGILMLGPNCIGYSNAIDGFAVSFVNLKRLVRFTPDRVDPALAMVSHSGALMFYAAAEFTARNLPMAYTISMGNEAGIGCPDFINFLAQDKSVATILLYVEEIRHPSAFLAAARTARSNGKHVVMVNPGRGNKAREAVHSHTGALTGNYEAMRAHMRHVGILVVDTIEELVDVGELITRFPTPPTKGPGIITFSGGYCAIANDFCEDLGLEVPNLSPSTVATLTPLLPAFTPPKNPLDLGAQVLWQPELTGAGAKALMDDDELGSLIIAINGGPPASQIVYGKYFVDELKTRHKPAIYSLPGAAPTSEFMELVRSNRIVFSRSNDRAIRAMAKITAYGKELKRAQRTIAVESLPALPRLDDGPQPEWLAKQVLTQIGIMVPQGKLVGSVEEAEDVANRIGYPVALKVQSKELVHKTEVGGVALGIQNSTELRVAWDSISDNVRSARPSVELDGILVERMAAKGQELVIGAKRDPKWGPIVLVGLGGIWVEAFGDVVFLLPDMVEGDIIAELEKLRGAKLLHGFRGAPAVDIEAIATTAALIGRLMLKVPEITEIEINPAVAHSKGAGVTAADALIVIKYSCAPVGIQHDHK